MECLVNLIVIQKVISVTINDNSLITLHWFADDFDDNSKDRFAFKLIPDFQSTVEYLRMK